MNFTPITLAQWWFLFHLVGSASQDGVAAARLPRSAHGLSSNQADGTPPADGDVAHQALSLQESSGTPLPGSSRASRRSRVLRWCGRCFRGNRYGSPARTKSRNFSDQYLQKEVLQDRRDSADSARTVACSSCVVEPGAHRSKEQKESEKVQSGLLPPTEALGDDPFGPPSRSATPAFSMPVEEGASVGGRSKARWIDIKYPFFQRAMSTISLTARKMIADVIDKGGCRAPRLGAEEAHLVEVFEQDLLTDPLVLEPCGGGNLSLVVRRGGAARCWWQCVCLQSNRGRDGERAGTEDTLVPRPPSRTRHCNCTQRKWGRPPSTSDA